MYNSKKRLGITVLIWVVLVILTALALWSTELNADSGLGKLVEFVSGR